jgi:antitoxin (DNA-binding transcriptional repressor) of toxin-antitoxin stability system
MRALTVNVTEFSRGLSDFLNQVQYRGQVLDIERGKRVVARLSPVAQMDGYPVAQLDGLLANGPQLSAAERASLAKDIASTRAQLRGRSDAWA